MIEEYKAYESSMKKNKFVLPLCRNELMLLIKLEETFFRVDSCFFYLFTEWRYNLWNQFYFRNKTVSIEKIILIKIKSKRSFIIRDHKPFRTNYDHRTCWHVDEVSW